MGATTTTAKEKSITFYKYLYSNFQTGDSWASRHIMEVMREFEHSKRVGNLLTIEELNEMASKFETAMSIIKKINYVQVKYPDRFRILPHDADSITFHNTGDTIAGMREVKDLIIGYHLGAFVAENYARNFPKMLLHYSRCLNRVRKLIKLIESNSPTNPAHYRQRL